MPLRAAGVRRQPLTEALAERAEPFANLGLTAYDACYAALAGELGGRWLTYDRKAHRRIRSQGVPHSTREGLPPDWPQRPPLPR